MPNARDLTEFFSMLNAVHDPIGAKNDLANIVAPVFRDDATDSWKLLQAISLGNKFISERHRSVWIVARDKYDYVVQVIASGGRPD